MKNITPELYKQTIRKKQKWLMWDFLLTAPTIAFLYFLGKACPTCMGVAFFITIPLLVLAMCGIISLLRQSISLILFVHKNKKHLPKTEPQHDANSPQLTISSLLNAVISAKLENVRAILAQDSTQLNNPYAQNGNTPLHVAAWNGYKNIVELLLAQPGIDTQAKNLAGKTALDLAQEKNFTDIIELLKFTEQK